MNEKTKVTLAILGGVLLASLLYLAGSSIPVLGSAPPGLSAGTSTMYRTSASSTAGFIMNFNNSCSSRTISTASTSIMLAFGSSTPSASFGHWQGASTTVAYDSGLYGCGQWSVYGFGTGQITITEHF